MMDFMIPFLLVDVGCTFYFEDYWTFFALLLKVISSREFVDQIHDQQSNLDFSTLLMLSLNSCFLLCFDRYSFDGPVPMTIVFQPFIVDDHFMDISD